MQTLAVNILKVRCRRGPGPHLAVCRISLTPLVFSMILISSLAGDCWIRSPFCSTFLEHFLLGMWEGTGSSLYSLSIFHPVLIRTVHVLLLCHGSIHRPTLRFAIVGLDLSVFWVKHYYSHFVTASPLWFCLSFWVSTLFLPLSLWWNFQKGRVINVYVKAAMFN